MSKCHLLPLLALSLAFMHPLHAAQVSVGARASAIDIPNGFDNQVESDSQQGFDPPVASVSVAAHAGDSLSSAVISADARSGEMHVSLVATTAPPTNGFPVGRDATASGDANLQGDITLSSGLPPGVATFSAVLEGLYNGGPADAGLGNFFSGTYSYQVGDQSIGGALEFNGGQAGPLNIPLSIVLPVTGGETIHIDLSLYSLFMESIGGSMVFDASHTFKITAIDLPPGYTYTSDAGGFLSSFDVPVVPTPVPEPATWLMLAAGLFAVTVSAWQRGRRSDAPALLNFRR